MARQNYNHENLVVWQRAMNLAEHVYRVTRNFPKEEIYGLTSQIRRAGLSAPLNIAKDQSRGSKKEFRQFLFIARGSLYELNTALILASKLGYVTRTEYKNLDGKIIEVTKLVNGLINSLKITG